MAVKNTKERILGAAEKLFAEHGFDATSIRDIATKAGVNLAAINYHFQSKEKLIYEVFARRVIPINKERIRLLDEAEGNAKGKSVLLEKIVRSLIEPAFRVAGASKQDLALFRRLYGRVSSDPTNYLRGIYFKLIAEVIERFTRAFKKALPHLDNKKFFWRMYLMKGAMVYCMYESDKLKIMSKGICDPTNVDEMIDRLVEFLVPALKAPVAKKKRKKRRR